eukprot:scaffold9503_cov27-Tisochrysis_lutea.AAC.1
MQATWGPKEGPQARASTLSSSVFVAQSELLNQPPNTRKPCLITLARVGWAMPPSSPPSMNISAEHPTPRWPGTAQNAWGGNVVSDC